MKELITKNFELFQMASGDYKAFVYDRNICRRLNKLLKEYPDYTFQEGEEAVFHFSPGMLTQVKIALKIKG